MSTSRRTHLYLSPHLDDAVLSCGGMLDRHTQAGERVVVVTLCAGDPPAGQPFSAYAQSLHARWQTPPQQTVSLRRAEDRAALQILGADLVHLPVPDCIYRTDPTSGEPLYTSDAALFGEVHASDAALVDQCAALLSAELKRFQPDCFYVPLGLGHHVDHQLARRAAEAVGSIYAYFEDYPYAAQESDGSLQQQAVGLTPELIALAEADLNAKCRTIAAYASQISSFWADGPAMELAVREFAARTGGGVPGERLWRPA